MTITTTTTPRKLRFLHWCLVVEYHYACCSSVFCFLASWSPSSSISIGRFSPPWALGSAGGVGAAGAAGVGVAAGAVDGGCAGVVCA